MIPQIPVSGLVIAFVPALVVIVIMLYWHSIARTAIYATTRMLVQLLLIGYVLVFIFETDNWLVIVGVLTVMLVASSWISTRTLRRHDHVVRLVRDIRCLLPEPATPPRYRLGDRQL